MWPTYKSIQDHTEAVRVVFDRSKLSYEEVLRHFFDQQGGPPSFPGFSTQYRSAILFHTTEQKKLAEAMLRNLAAAKGLMKVFTDLEDSGGTEFYKAEEYHQKFMEKQRMRGRY